MNGPTTQPTDKSWPVEVIRHTLEKGWEKMQFDNGRKTWVLARVHQGGIEIPQFRVRYRVYPKHDGSSTQHSLKLNVAKKRKTTIFIPSPRKGGCVVLRFKSTEQCASFFAVLNDVGPGKPRRDPSDTPGAMSTSLVRAKRQTQSPNASSDGREAASSDAARVAGQQTEMAQYMVRLLHDEHFLRFVKGLEEQLTSRPDTAKMLAAFSHPNSTDTEH